MAAVACAGICCPNFFTYKLPSAHLLHFSASKHSAQLGWQGKQVPLA